MFSLVSIPQRENPNAIFANDKLEVSYKLVNIVANTTINDVGYELNATTESDTQVKFAIDPEKNTYTSNGINHQKLLSSRTVNMEYLRDCTGSIYDQVACGARKFHIHAFEHHGVKHDSAASCQDWC